MTKFQPKDIIAFSSIFAMLALKLKGVDGSLDAAIGLILGYYFAHRTDGVDNGV